jgi:hypothetical protein
VSPGDASLGLGAASVDGAATHDGAFVSPRGTDAGGAPDAGGSPKQTCPASASVAEGTYRIDGYVARVALGETHPPLSTDTCSIFGEAETLTITYDSVAQSYTLELATAGTAARAVHRRIEGSCPTPRSNATIFDVNQLAPQFSLFVGFDNPTTIPLLSYFEAETVASIMYQTELYAVGWLDDGDGARPAGLPPAYAPTICSHKITEPGCTWTQSYPAAGEPSACPENVPANCACIVIPDSYEKTCCS